MFARFHAAMSRTEPNGSTRRASLEASAANGNAVAIAALVEPAFPDVLAHVWAWLLEIRQGLGAGMEGLHSLTWTALDAWCRLTRRDPSPEEVDILFAVDRALRETEPVKTPDGATPTAPRVAVGAWPDRKPGVEPIFVTEAD